MPPFAEVNESSEATFKFVEVAFPNTALFNVASPTAAILVVVALAIIALFKVESPSTAKLVEVTLLNKLAPEEYRLVVVAY